VLGVHPQKQAGLNWVGACVPAGRMHAEDFDEVARIAEVGAWWQGLFSRVRYKICVTAMGTGKAIKAGPLTITSQHPHACFLQYAIRGVLPSVYLSLAYLSDCCVSFLSADLW
jgi:hypothetical protein